MIVVGRVDSYTLLRRSIQISLYVLYRLIRSKEDEALKLKLKLVIPGPTEIITLLQGEQILSREVSIHLHPRRQRSSYYGQACPFATNPHARASLDQGFRANSLGLQNPPICCSARIPYTSQFEAIKTAYPL